MFSESSLPLFRRQQQLTAKNSTEKQKNASPEQNRTEQRQHINFLLAAK